ncbi:MAG: hypothetical protein Q9216_003897 [Gyalolechia sp. 2 TL-2023]
MKILATQSAALTNHEVSSHISSLRSRPRSSPRPSNSQTILEEVSTYLHSYQADSSSPLPPTISSEQIEQLTRELRKFGLEKGEVLMLLNLRPKELGLLDCVVEECDMRLTEEQQEAVLECVGRVMGAGEGYSGDDVRNGHEVENGNEEGRGDEDRAG